MFPNMNSMHVFRMKMTDNFFKPIKNFLLGVIHRLFKHHKPSPPATSGGSKLATGRLYRRTEKHIVISKAKLSKLVSPIFLSSLKDRMTSNVYTPNVC